MSVPPWFSKLYNAGIHQYTWKLTFKLPKIMSTSFYHTELSRALSEQAFGLARFDVYGGSSPHEATASVTLLEGKTIRITLTARGYQVRMACAWFTFTKISFSLTAIRFSNLLKASCRPSVPPTKEGGERPYFRVCEAYPETLFPVIAALTLVLCSPDHRVLLTSFQRICSIFVLMYIVPHIFVRRHSALLVAHRQVRSSCLPEKEFGRKFVSTTCITNQTCSSSEKSCVKCERGEVPVTHRYIRAVALQWTPFPFASAD